MPLFGNTPKPVAPIVAPGLGVPSRSGFKLFISVLKLIVIIVIAPVIFVRWAWRDPQRGVPAFFAMLFVRHILLPSILLTLAPGFGRAFMSHPWPLLVGGLFDKIEMLATAAIVLTVVFAILRRRSTRKAQRQITERIVNDPSKGALARINFSPGASNTRPTLAEMGQVFSNFGTQLAKSFKAADILKTGAPTVSFELIRSAHYRDGEPSMLIWTPVGLVPDPIDVLDRSFRAGLSAGTGTAYLHKLDQELGGDGEKVVETHVRNILGLPSKSTSPEEAASTHVVMQRLTVNPHPAVLGRPLVPYNPKSEPDYLAPLLAQMKVGKEPGTPNSIGVQVIIRRVDPSYWSWAAKTITDKLSGLNMASPKELGITARVQKDLIAAADVFMAKASSPTFQTVIQIFATFRGDNPLPAQASVEAVARHFQNGNVYRFQQAPVADDPVVASLQVFVPLTAQDARPIVASFKRYSAREMAERAHQQLTQARLAPSPVGPRRSPWIGFITILPRVLDRWTARLADKIRLKLTSGKLAPVFSRTSRFYKQDPLADFKVPPREVPAEAPPLGEELSLDDLFAQLQSEAVPPPALIDSTPAPTATTKAEAAAPVPVEEGQLTSEAKLVYESILARAFPVQMHSWFAKPNDMHLYPGIGVLGALELPMVYHLSKDPSVGQQARRLPVSPELAFRELYTPDHITFGTGLTESGEEVYIGIPKKQLRQSCRIMAPPGTGKSRLLETLAFQYAKDGHGMLLIEPTGEFLNRVLEDIAKYAPERLADVIYWDLEDKDRPIGINIMERPEDESMWSSAIDEIMDVLNSAASHGGEAKDVGQMMGSYMPTVIQSLWRLPEPKENLAALQLFLQDDDFRNSVIESTVHPNTRVMLNAFISDSASRLENKLETSQRRVARIMNDTNWTRLLAQPQTGFNAREIMEGRRILMVRLATDQAVLVARFLLAKFHEAMYTRRIDVENDFPIMIDEFSKYAEKARSVPQLLAEGRKYGLPMYIVHQYEAQAEAGSSTALLRQALKGVQVHWTFRADASAGAEFANIAPMQLTKQDVTLLPKSRVGYIAVAGRAMTVQSLDTDKLSSGLTEPAKFNSDAPTGPVPLMPTDQSDLPELLVPEGIGNV